MSARGIYCDRFKLEVPLVGTNPIDTTSRFTPLLGIVLRISGELEILVILSKRDNVPGTYVGIRIVQGAFHQSRGVRPAQCLHL
jgi:hypothetical protein